MVALGLAFVVEAKLPRSTHRKSDWMGLAQCGDCWEARRAMNLSDWLDMEDHRPGVPAVTVRKEARLIMLQARSHSFSFFSATCPDLQTPQEACLFYAAAPLAGWAAFTPESFSTHLFLGCLSSSLAASPVSTISEHVLPPATCPSSATTQCHMTTAMVDGWPSPLSSSQTGCPPKALVCHSFHRQESSHCLTHALTSGHLPP